MYRFPVWSDGCCWELTESFHITQNAIYKRNAGEECDDFFYEFIREKFLDGKYFFLSFIRTGESEQIYEEFFITKKRFEKITQLPSLFNEIFNSQASPSVN